MRWKAKPLSVFGWTMLFSCPLLGRMLMRQHSKLTVLQTWDTCSLYEVFTVTLFTSPHVHNDMCTLHQIFTVISVHHARCSQWYLFMLPNVHSGIGHFARCSEWYSSHFIRFWSWTRRQTMTWLTLTTTHPTLMRCWMSWMTSVTVDQRSTPSVSCQHPNHGSGTPPGQ